MLTRMPRSILVWKGMWHFLHTRLSLCFGIVGDLVKPVGCKRRILSHRSMNVHTGVGVMVVVVVAVLRS